LLAVTPANFQEQLDVIKRRYRPMSLQQLIQSIEEKRITPYSVAVTFDDGYRDNLLYGKPVLEQYAIPATVFITCGYVGKQDALWWDELEDIFLGRRKLPPSLHLALGGDSLQWQLEEAAASSEMLTHSIGWNILDPKDPTPRHKIYRYLVQALRRLPTEQRDSMLSDLRLWAGSEPNASENNRVLSPQEIVSLTNGGLLDVGSHTLTHPVLAVLSKESQQREIRDSKVCLEEIVGRAIASFAYPYGTRADYTRETSALVKASGYQCACSNYRDIVWSRSNTFQLPRVLVRNWNGELFEKRMEEWFHG
jgi:peptidoglycan/xylan/chitin deacetylase (PgdA/CDA1 family)